MAWTGGKRFIAELVATAVISPLFCILLTILVRGTGLLKYLLLPVLIVASPIARWINQVSPPQPDGSWFPGLGTFFITGVVVAWVGMWMLLMIIVRLHDIFSDGRRELE